MEHISPLNMQIKSRRFKQIAEGQNKSAGIKSVKICEYKICINLQETTIKKSPEKISGLCSAGES